MSDSSTHGVRSILELFMADHRRLAELGRKLHRALLTGGDDNKSLWKQLRDGLVVHIGIEEQFMIPALSRVQPRQAQAILAEHGLIRDRIADIEARTQRDEKPANVVDAFVFELEAHARHEERTLYAWADVGLDDRERELLLTRYEAARSASSAASSSSTFTGLVR